MEIYVQQSKTMMVINALLLIVIGALFIINKDLALQWGFILAGVFLIISGILPMIIMKAVDIIGILMIILGIIMILAPYAFAWATIWIIGIIAILLGVLILFGATRTSGKEMIVMIIVGLLLVVAGALTFIGNDLVFIIFGVVLVLAGVVNLLGLAVAGKESN
jgi:uncharacterized membrane protein HdeD (DUF308 family)